MGRTKRKRLRKLLGNSFEAIDYEENTINLRKFMKRNGFKKEFNLKICNFPETGRGVTTMKRLCENDVIINVPYNLMVTYTTLQSSNFFELFTVGDKLTIHDLLTVFLVMEKHKKGSFWSDYINSLPHNPPWFPSLLSMEYIELLPVDLKLAAKKSRRLLKESWSRVRKSIQRDWTCNCCSMRADCVLDLNTFTWGYILVNTRAVYVNPDIVRKMSDYSEDIILSDEPSMALCPYLDMFNHSSVARSKAELIYFQGNLVFQLITLTSCEKYEQVFISYGAHDNVKLIMEYGFFIPGNCYDCIRFRSEDIFKVLKLNLSDIQYRFICGHSLNQPSDLYISEVGPSFNLKALLFVVSNPSVKNFSSIIYGDNYPRDFQETALFYCQKLSYVQLRTVEEILKNFEDLGLHFKDETSLIIDFLRYRKKFMKILCHNKQ